VPLQADAEAPLFILVERPDLDAPKLRTVGLKIMLGRLETMLGGLPIDVAQLGKAADWFYGDHKANADGLVQESAPRSDTRWRPSARRPACC
jgi:hypothetical protein